MLYAHGTTFNYYRAFLEHDLALLAPGGRLGVTIDSGVASDAATAEHRRELLDHCTIDQFVLCDNKNGIFPIHSREQFLLLVAGKGGATDPLPVHQRRLPSGTPARPGQPYPAHSAAPRSPRWHPRPWRSPTPATPPCSICSPRSTATGRCCCSRCPRGGWPSTGDANSTSTMTGNYFAADAARRAAAGRQAHPPVRQRLRRAHLPPGRTEGERALLKRAMKRAKIKGDPARPPRRSGEQPLSEAGVRPGGLEIPVRPVPARFPGNRPRN